jgi:pimeloyl-ACP methyl ester carboxylesterase
MALAQQFALKYIRTKFSILSAISKKAAAQQAFQLFCTPQHRNRKPLPPIFEKAEILRFNFLDYQVQGYRWNAGQERKVLILHGFESSAVNFDRYVKPLLKKGFEVLAFDAPAHGRSTGKIFNALLYKQFIQTVCKSYGPVQSFLAHSLGGLALSLALEDIEHDSSYNVALIAPATETTTAIDSFFTYLKLDAALRPWFDKIILEQSGHTTDWFSVSRVAPFIKANVLWAHDKDDAMTPFTDIQHVMNAGYPNFQFLITEGLGHRRIYRDNKISKAVLEFL